MGEVIFLNFWDEETRYEAARIQQLLQVECLNVLKQSESLTEEESIEAIKKAMMKILERESRSICLA